MGDNINMQDAGLPTIFGDDGGSHSPGHCAKYGTYTKVNQDKWRMIDIRTLQVNLLSPRFMFPATDYVYSIGILIVISLLLAFGWIPIWPE